MATGPTSSLRRYVAWDTPAFTAAFHQGLGALVGVLVGLGIWVAYQPTPVIPPYQAVLTLKVAAAPPAPPAPAPVVASPAAVPPPASPAPTPVTPEPTPTPAATTAPPVHQDTPPKQPTVTPPPTTPAPPPASAAPTPSTPFAQYRRVVPPTTLDKPVVILMMRQAGLSAKITEDALATLPPDVTLLRPPVAPAMTPELQARLKKDRIETWLDLAVEPDDYPASDPGAGAIMTRASVDQNQQALAKQLSSAPQVAGVIVTTESPITQGGGDLDLIGSVLFKQGLGLTVLSGAVSSTLRADARAAQAPHYQGPVIHLTHPRDLAAQKRTIERQAQSQGFVLVMFDPSPKMIDDIAAWTAQIKTGGVMNLAPLSVVVERGQELMP